MFANSRKLLVPLATMAVAGVVTVGSGATWTSQTTKTTTVAAGELVITNNAGGATLNLANLKPGDVRTGSITITNDGTVDAKVAIAESVTDTNDFSVFDNGTPALSTDDKRVLQIHITRDGATVYNGDFGGLEGLGPWTGGATLLAVDNPGTSGVVEDKTTIEFTVTMLTEAIASDQNKTAGAGYSFTITPAATTGTAPWS